MKKTARIIVIVLLLGTGVVGILNGIRERDDGLTSLQRSVTFAVLIYGLLGIVGGVGLTLRRAWALPVTVGWAFATTYAATVASFAFHDPTFQKEGTLMGTLSSFVATVLINAFMIWTVRSAVRTASAPLGEPASPGV